MVYALSRVYKPFLGELTALDSLAARLLSDPLTLERDVHIEGCFLRMMVAWENFVEEVFLRSMCGARTLNGGLIRPKGRRFTNTALAYKMLHRQGSAREKDYLDWLTHSIVKKRLDDHFRSNTRLNRLLADTGLLDDARVIRNAVAHRSVSSLRKARDRTRSRLGSVHIEASVSDIILGRDIVTMKPLFQIVSEYFAEAALYIVR